MKLTDIRDALNGVVGVPFYHYESKSEQAYPYGVWGETGSRSGSYAGNKTRQINLIGFVEYYTVDEYDENIEKIQNALNDSNVAWRLTLVTYNDVTQTIEYRWEWEGTCGLGFNS